MAGPTNPLALQSLLGDINTRRAIAAALRAREGQGATGDMVSGRYVPNLSGVGGTLARGLFGDPMDALRQEEQGALQSYGDELAGATEGVLGLGADTPDADFARSVARGQTAGVSPEVMKAAMGRRQSMQMFDDFTRMLDKMGQPQQVAAGGGVPPVGVRGAPPAGAPASPPVGVPQQGGQEPPQGGGNDAFARAVAPGGGVVQQMAGIPEGKLLLMAVTLPQGHPMGALVEAEIKSRKLENKDGMLMRNGQFVGQLKDGIFIDPQGNAVNLAGAAKAAQAGAEAKAQEAAKAGFRTETVTGPDGTKAGYVQDIYGTPPALRGQGGAAPPAGNPSARFNYNGTVGGAQQALGAIAADQAGGMGGGVQDVPGGGRVIAGPNPMAVRQREADIGTRAKAAEGINTDFLAGSYRPTIDAGNNAKQTIGQLDAIDRLNVQGGWSAAAQGKGAQILNGLGIAPQEAKKYAAKLETFYSIVGAQSWQLLAEQKGMQTEGDAKRAAMTLQRVENTPQANRFIGDFARAVAMQKIEKAEFFRRALPDAQKEGDLSRIESAWAQQQKSIFDYPFMQQWGQIDNNAAASSPAPAATDDELGRYMQQYGPKGR